MVRRPWFLVVLLAVLFAAVRCGSPPDVSNGGDGFAGHMVGSTAGSGNGRGGGTSLDIDSGTPMSDGGCTGDTCEPDQPVAVCGNGMLEAGEGCDDGNHTASDGCTADCKVQKDYVCKTPGKPCTSTVVCGDGKTGTGESCDDGNHTAGDGCDANCQIEDGYGCEAGTDGSSACMPVSTTKCGDGIKTANEGCDDGNVVDGDGCTKTCTVVDGYSCPNPGQLCTLDTVTACGNGQLNEKEQCDDGNTDIGDGCDAFCALENFYACPTPGKPCVSTIVCGDGKVVGDEACDDGNTTANDGCAADCKNVEGGYTCPTASGVGGACTKAAVGSCGDSILDAANGEYCDDGNTVAKDGCTACLVDAGYTCPTAGSPCKVIAYCGDGKLSVALGEQCDDGNTTSKDGCSPQCVIEANYSCTTPGTPCTSTVVCGDKKVTGAETCDDGNLAASDGCSPTCQVEAGYTCPSGGVCKATKCGDGIRVGFEQCDDGNAVNNDGCSSTCQLESGYKCDPNASSVDVCTKTTCGDNKKEGTEQCDDGNLTPFDGCSPACTNEPKCGYNASNKYGCVAVCGDGMIFPGEDCDDGNTNDGDGCNHLCVHEDGYQCVATLPTLPNPLVLPIIYRDFKPTHPQFEIDPVNGIRRPNIPLPALGTDGKPAYNTAYGGYTLNGAKPATAAATLTTTTQISDAFHQWYTNVDTVNFPIVSTLSLPFVAADNAYEFYSSAFFPIDGQGFGNYSTYGHNYHFTSELRNWFAYAGGEVLQFRGDDDVWVFVNGQLTVDLGGIHGELQGTITLNGAASTLCTNEAVGGASTCTTVNVPLTKGTVYEIVVFQAERHVTGSNYKLTLQGFNAARSVCSPICGDGVVTKTEACDLGTAKNTGAYGTCNADCTLPPRCGDGIKNGTELCDDGVNLSTNGGASKQCGPGCVFAPYCGDSKVDGANGEACDQGTDNGKGYGFCSASCQLGPRCGDGVTQAGSGETCDDGTNNGNSTSLCQSDCKLKCGNGTLDPGEKCDNGTANNTGGYGKCKANCTLDTRCGDGIKNGTEQCDDGKNDGSYGYCAPGCVLGPRCGDGTVQSTAGEVCDAGANNSSSAYGKNLCTTHCLPAPYCGNKAVDTKFGEVCDDGVNSGQPGSCAADCSAYIPLASCGDGVVKAPEQCDAGSANGTSASTCDKHCKLKCGNGVVDDGETCDDGVDNGNYGTCTSTCGFAGYCGDGKKNGPEQCDLGDGKNEASPYGAGKCSTACTIAPYCGDGYIQSAYEQCDGAKDCSATCTQNVPK